MKAESEKLSAHQSLDIITGMIRQAQGTVRRSSFHFLLWGWVVALANMGMFTLIYLNYPRPYLVWLLAIPAWFISMYYGYKYGNNSTGTTHIERITMWLWISFGVIVFTLVFFGSQINFKLNPVILLVSALPTFISGLMIRFKPLVIGGIAFWIFGIVCFLVPMYYHYLIGALAVIVGYIIPGYLLKYNKEYNV
jgi:hypothetical protein